MSLDTQFCNLEGPGIKRSMCKYMLKAAFEGGECATVCGDAVTLFACIVYDLSLLKVMPTLQCISC